MRTPIPFDRNVEAWILYSESPRGRLRHGLTWHNLRKHLASRAEDIRVLDAGCGLGEMAAFLLEMVREIVLLDFSEGMLMEAKRRLTERYPRLAEERVSFVQGRVEALDSCLPREPFEVVLCHTLLEYVADPGATLVSLVGRLTPGGMLSVVTVNRYSEAIRLALVEKDLAGARRALHAGHFKADLFDRAPKRAFSFEEIAEMLAGLDLTIEGRYGIRIFADYLPEALRAGPEQERLLVEMEREASELTPYLHLARYHHIVCRRGD